MKPSQMFEVLDLALRVRKQGRTFIPLFVGAPGLGKSEIVQQWCKTKGLPYKDLRAAYLEAPDVIGYPTVENRDGRQITVHNTPEFWPTSGEGVLLLEEPNRGTTSIMNTFMQLLTDRKVHNYTLPEGWIIVACINPESEENDVNTMDMALKNRFEIFEVDYSKDDFLKYMKASSWDQNVIGFVETGAWTYTKPADVSKNENAQYVSPRSFSKLNAALKAGLETKDMEKLVYEAVLGRNIGMSFYHFVHDEQPVTYAQLANKKTMKQAIEKLKIYGNPGNYKAGSIATTIRDIVENDKEKVVSDAFIVNVCMALPADQAPKLISDLEVSRGLKDNELLVRLTNDSKDLRSYLKGVLKQK